MVTVMDVMVVMLTVMLTVMVADDVDGDVDGDAIEPVEVCWIVDLGGEVVGWRRRGMSSWLYYM